VANLKFATMVKNLLQIDCSTFSKEYDIKSNAKIRSREEPKDINFQK
jgi:hypothetical protein